MSKHEVRSGWRDWSFRTRVGLQSRKSDPSSLKRTDLDGKGKGWVEDVVGSESVEEGVPDVLSEWGGTME